MYLVRIVFSYRRETPYYKFGEKLLASRCRHRDKTLNYFQVRSLNRTPYPRFYCHCGAMVAQGTCNAWVADSSSASGSTSGVSEAVITMVCLTIITGSIPVRLAISLGIPLKTRGSL